MAGGIHNAAGLSLALMALVLSSRLMVAEAALLGERPLPTFRQPGLGDGMVWDSAALRGHVALIVLWAPWCTICMGEWPELAALQDELGPSGLRLVALTMDAPADQQARTALAEQLHLPFPVIVGDDALRRRFRGVRGYPTLVLADQAGNIRKQWAGPPPSGELVSAIRKLLPLTAREGPQP
ncbi:MAG: TlpA disulfide reductase family protein [Candidatus Sericytochromatia bacterium]|nr:TlpA disulfide reductase family protein [Candidatus Sericytochromatia bacterium]